MLGFDDGSSEEPTASYGLVDADGHRRNRSPNTLKACYSVFAVSAVLALVLVSGRADAWAAPSTMLLAVGDDSGDDAGAAPFGQCGGMNFSNPGEGPTYNFSSPAQQFKSCPAGFTCIAMGPVWAMCMPELTPAAAAWQQKLLLMDLKSDGGKGGHDEKPKADKKPPKKAEKPKKEESPTPAAGEPCPTKPFQRMPRGGSNPGPAEGCAVLASRFV